MKVFDRKLAEEIVASGDSTVKELGLRFDKVVVSLFGELRTFAGKAVPDGKVLVLTMTAPILQPGKTCRQIEEMLEQLRPSAFSGKKMTIQGNKVQMKMLNVPEGRSRRVPKFIGFVHNPTTNPRRLFEMATDWVEKS